MRHGNRNASRYGIGSADTVRHDVWRGSRERRAWCNPTQTTCCISGVVPLAERQARRNGEYAWNRLHAVERNSVRARIGKKKFSKRCFRRNATFQGLFAPVSPWGKGNGPLDHMGASRGLWLA